MKKLNSLLLMLVIAFSSVALTSCFDDDDEDKEDCAEVLRAALEFSTTKAQAMAMNPSRSTCDAYKASLKEYLEKAEDCDNKQHEDAAEALLDQAEVTCNGL